MEARDQRGAVSGNDDNSIIVPVNPPRAQTPIPFAKQVRTWHFWISTLASLVTFLAGLELGGKPGAIIGGVFAWLVRMGYLGALETPTEKRPWTYEERVAANRYRYRAGLPQLNGFAEGYGPSPPTPTPPALTKPTTTTDVPTAPTEKLFQEPAK